MIHQSRPLFDELPVERACGLLSVSRADYYLDRQRAQRPGPLSGADPLREAIEAVVLAWPAYGYRRVTAQLQREGWAVNHKRVLRLMREEGWLCRRRRPAVRTTDSDHALPIYPNLLARGGWRNLTRLDEAWLADLTYIRLPEDFCYLAAILDGFSRRVVGWCLSLHLDARVALTALDQALARRAPAAGWIHHSDRGVQYASRDYVACVLSAGGQVSMSRRGMPRDNAPMESFVRTLKHEAVYLDEYANYGEAERSIGRFIDDVYNEKRLHSSLGYRPPSEFEELFAAGVLH